MSDSQTLPLVFFSGLAADDTVFAPQKLAFPSLIVPAWPAPSRNETLDDYARRIASELALNEPMIIGGASFGGIVALHLAKYVQPLAVVLIGSVRTPEELPRYAKWARVLRPLVPLLPVRVIQFGLLPLAMGPARKFAPFFAGVVRQFRRSDPKVIKWSLARLLDWEQRPLVDCPILQIHGERDFVLPARHTNPNELLDKGGHLISLTHGREVNEIIRSLIDEFAPAEKSIAQPSPR